MLTKTCFDRCMNTLLAFAEVAIDSEKNKAFYNLMKKDFEDVEFSAMCEDICKTELLYGRYPAPKLFYDRKKKNQAEILIEEGTFYLDDTFPEYRAVLEDLSTDKRDKICLDVWNWLMETHRGEMVSKQFIIDRLKQFRPQQRQDDYPTLSEIKKLIDDHNNTKPPFDIQ